MHHGAVGEDGEVRALARQRRLAEGNRVVADRHVARGVTGPGRDRPVMVTVEGAGVEPLRLEDENGVVVLDGGDEEALGVVGVRGDHRLDAADMGEQPFRALAVGLASEDAAAIGRAHRDRRVELPGGAVAQAGGLGNELVEARVYVVGELALDDRPKPVGAHADGDGRSARPRRSARRTRGGRYSAAAVPRLRGRRRRRSRHPRRRRARRGRGTASRPSRSSAPGPCSWSPSGPPLVSTP